MKKIIALAALILVLSAAVGQAAPGQRVVEKDYEPVYFIPSGTAGSIYASNGVRFRPKAGERFFSVAITDSTGLPVPARIEQDTDGDEEPDIQHEFCGATDSPVEIVPDAQVVVWMIDGTCGDAVGGWTTGVMTATFTR